MGCGISKFDLPEGTGPNTFEANYIIDDNNNTTNSTISSGGDEDHAKDHKENVVMSTRRGRKRLSSFLNDRRFLKRVANASSHDHRDEKERDLLERENIDPKSKTLPNDDNGDQENDARGDGILMAPGSPSFRVYCDHQDDSSSCHDEDAGDEEIETKSSPKYESRKGSKRQAADKRRRKAKGFRSVLHRGGSAGMKRFLNASSGNHNSLAS